MSLSFSFSVKIFAEAHHDVVGILVILQVVEGGLIHLRHIAQAEGGTAEGDFDREAVVHGGHVAGIGEEDVAVVVLQGKYLVVALSVVGGEGDAHEGEGELVAPHVMAAAYLHVESGQRACLHHEARLQLGGVVAAAHHVDASQIASGGKAGCQAQGRGRALGGVHHVAAAEIVEPPLRVAYAAGILVVVAGAVVGGGEVHVYEPLVAHMRMPQVGHARGFALEAEVGAGVVVGRQVGVENVGPSYSEHGGVEHFLVGGEGAGGGGEGRGILCPHRKAQHQHCRCCQAFTHYYIYRRFHTGEKGEVLWCAE